MKLKLFYSLLFIFSISYVFSYNTENVKKEKYINKIMEGIEPEYINSSYTYVTPGNKTFIVGTQNGLFPDLGETIPNEMGGIWNTTIKLMDGFWTKISNGSDNIWLNNANRIKVLPYGTVFSYNNVIDEVECERFQFCPDDKNGVIIEYLFKNKSNEKKEFTFDFYSKTDLQPMWLGLHYGLRDGKDIIEWEPDYSAFVSKDSLNEWYVVWGTDVKPYKNEIGCEVFQSNKGYGNTASLSYKLSIPAKKELKISFYVAGSEVGKLDALNTLHDLKVGKLKLINEKKLRYEKMLHESYIVVPDKKVQEVYNWSKLNMDWLVAHPKGYEPFLCGASLQYPWLYGSDSEFAVQGIAAYGNFDLAESTLKVLKDTSVKINGNGRIIHEMSLNGHVGNRGNTQETPLFIIAAWNVYQWTGNRAFLEELYPYMKLSINWLFNEQDTDGNLFPEGYGVMEVNGLNAELIDVVAYSQKALEIMSYISGIFSDNELSNSYMEKAKILKDRINTLFWSEEEGLYYDFYGSKRVAEKCIQGAINQRIADKKYYIENGYQTEESFNDLIKGFKELGKEIEVMNDSLRSGWFTNKNWVISTPAEIGIATKEQAIRLLDNVYNNHTGKYGPYLGAFDNKRMMLLPAAVQTVAECQYGRVDYALDYLSKIVSTFSKGMPGSLSETLPDEQCPVICWSSYAIATPLLSHFMGVKPDAYNKYVKLKPNLPTAWDYMEIYNMRIGDNVIDYRIKRGKSGAILYIDSKHKNWSYEVDDEYMNIEKCFVDGINILK